MHVPDAVPKREIRRLTRAAHLIWHLVVGMIVAYGVFELLAQLPHARAQRTRQRLVLWWIRRLCRILNLHVRVEGRAQPRATLFVANHVSWLDIPCLLSVVDADFVAKQEVQHWPVIGAMAARADTIFLARGERTSAATADQMTWRLAQQRSVILFPEGTTTDGRSVRPFHARLFQAAIRTYSPVQAMAIRYLGDNGLNPAVPFINDDELLRHAWALLAEERIVAHVRLCEARPPDTDRRSLANHTRAQIRAALELEPKASETLAPPVSIPEQAESF